MNAVNVMVAFLSYLLTASFLGRGFPVRLHPLGAASVRFASVTVSPRSRARPRHAPHPTCPGTPTLGRGGGGSPGGSGGLTWGRRAELPPLPRAPSAPPAAGGEAQTARGTRPALKAPRLEGSVEGCRKNALLTSDNPVDLRLGNH